LLRSALPAPQSNQHFHSLPQRFCRTPSPEEIIARRTARDLKIPTFAAIQIALPLMAALIDNPCWLVPVPAGTGSLVANLALARAIASVVPGARVKCMESMIDWKEHATKAVQDQPRRLARPFSPVSGKFRRLWSSPLPIYPGTGQSTISGSGTSRHYLAGVPQSTLPVIENSSHYREVKTRGLPCGRSGGWFWNHE
jgi:hypothetical protein